MYKLFTLLSAFAIAITAQAQLNGDGYYRLQNNVTKRYAYVIDDKGSLNAQTSSVDLYSIRLWKNFEKASSDPASVLYIEKVGSQYDIQAQGMGLYSMIDMYLSIIKRSNGCYWAYGKSGSFVKYLSDGVHSLSDGGWLSDSYEKQNDTDPEYRDWDIIPITSTSSDAYFGVKADITAQGKSYASFYASFPFSFASSGMKAMYIKLVDDSVAVLSEAKSSVIPGGTPVFISCNSTNPAENKLNIGGTATQSITDNLLKGVYFQNSMATHLNQVPYDPQTMRLLGVTASGKLGFVKSNVSYLPANKAYLTVATTASDDIVILTDEEYEEYLKKGDEPDPGAITTITADKESTFDIYNTLGIKVKANATSFDGLPTGVYISNGKKIIIH